MLMRQSRAGSDDAMALAMGGFVIGVLERNYETALEAIDRSLALSPSSALAFGFSSIIRAWMGDDDRRSSMPGWEFASVLTIL